LVLTTMKKRREQGEREAASLPGPHYASADLRGPTVGQYVTTEPVVSQYVANCLESDDATYRSIPESSFDNRSSVVSSSQYVEGAVEPATYLSVPDAIDIARPSYNNRGLVR